MIVNLRKTNLKNKHMLTLDKIYHARYVLKDVIRRTDLIQAPNINPDAMVFLKPENLQLTGSFKVRGSYYKISQLSEEEKKKGVIACSAGNHAQGVALAATKNGIKSTICLPDGAPISKIEATKNFWCRDMPCGRCLRRCLPKSIATTRRARLHIHSPL